MSRSHDKSLGRSFTEIGEILGMKEAEVKWAYETGMRKLRAENPENGRYLLEQLNTGCRIHARKVSRNVQGDDDFGDCRDTPDLQDLNTEPPHEELPEEIYE